MLAITFVLVERGSGWRQVLAALATVEPQWLAALFLVCLANNFASAWRLFLLVRPAASRPVRFWEVAKVNAAALFLGFWTPVSIVADGGRVLWLRNAVLDNYRGALVLVLWDRLLGLAALVVFMLPFSWVYARTIAAYSGIPSWTVLAIALGGLALVASFLYSKRRQLRIPPGKAWLPKQGDFWRHGLVGFLYVATYFVAITLAGASIGLAQHWWQFLVATPLLFFAQNLPITYGGLGSRELAFLVLLGSVVGDAHAITISLIVWLGFLMASLPGGAVLAVLRGKVA